MSVIIIEILFVLIVHNNYQTKYKRCKQNTIEEKKIIRKDEERNRKHNALLRADNVNHCQNIRIVKIIV